MSLSDFTVSDMTTELSIDAVFASLTASQQMQVFNSAQQRVANDYNAKGRIDYLSDNMSGTPGSILSGSDQSGVETNVITGRVVTFSSPFGTNKLATGDYALEVHGFQGTMEVHVSVTRSATQLILNPDAQCDYITWKASPFTQ